MGSGQAQVLKQSCDGEQIQIDGIFNDEEVLAALDMNLIYSVKHCASNSATSNAWDSCDFFKATRTRNKYCISKTVATGKIAMTKKVDAALAREVPGIELGKRNQVSDGIIKIQVAMQQSLTLQIVSNGFERTGQHPLDFKKKMRTCRSNISPDQLKVMLDNVEQFKNLVKLQGHIIEWQYDEKGIVRVHDERKIDEDERALRQQRCVLLNHKNTLDRFNAHKALIESRNYPRKELAQLKKAHIDEVKKLEIERKAVANEKARKNKVALEVLKKIQMDDAKRKRDQSQLDAANAKAAKVNSCLSTINPSPIDLTTVNPVPTIAVPQVVLATVTTRRGRQSKRARPK